MSAFYVLGFIACLAILKWLIKELIGEIEGPGI